MKKQLFTLIISVFLLAGYTVAQTFTISGKIDGVKTGKVELQAREAGKYVTKYSTGIGEDGTFILKGKVAEPDLHILRIGDLKGAISIFLDNSDISITGKSDNLMGCVITGSPSQDAYAKYNLLARAQMDLLRPLYASSTEAEKAGNKAEVKKLEVQIEELEKKQTAEKFAFARELGASPVAAFIGSMNAYDYENQAALEALVQGLGPGFAENKYVKSINERVAGMKLTAIGQMAPEFTQNDPDGKPVNLSDLKGKYVLVDFWASWCGPCRQENPNVVKTYQKYKNKNFTILGVSLDRDKDKWLEAIQKDNLTWTHVSDLKYWDNEVAVKYGIKSIPANLLLDKKGKIIGKNLRGDKLEEALAKALK